MMIGSRVLGFPFRAGSEKPIMEEAEACYYKENGDDVDPDITLSYIDERIQCLLGHFQKDFEGGFSADNLGSKFGGYGSFLPTYERLPSIRPHTIKQQSHCNAVPSPDNVPLEGSFQNLKAPPPERPEAISSRNSRETSGSIAGRLDSCLPSTEVTNTIYSGLGLDDSPMSSSENSSDVSEGMLPISQSLADEFPAKIIEEMTSFAVPHGVLISPLHDSLLSLPSKEKPFQETKPMISLEDQKDVLAKIVGEKTSMQKERNLVKKTRKEVGHRERQANLKNEVHACLGEEKTTIIHGKSDSEALEGKDFPPNELQCRPVSDSNHGLRNLKLSCSASDVSICKKEDRLEGRFKESNLETTSGQDCLKSGSKLRIKAGKALEQKKTVKISASLEVPSSLEDQSEGTMCNAYLKPQNKNLSRKATLHETDNDKVSIKIEKSGTIGKNKLIVLQNVCGKTASSFEEGIKIGSGAPKGRKDTDSDTPDFENKRHRFKLHSDEKVGANNRVVIERASGDLRKVRGLDDSGTEKFKYRNETKERQKGSRMDVHLCGASVKDGQGARPLVIDNDPGSKMVEPSVVVPVHVQHWVCCDSCQKWRLLPFESKPEQLPEKWLCRMLDWLPGMNRCDIEQDETTRMFYALYKLPMPESGDAIQIHANEPASGDAINQGKRKETLKVTQNPVSSIGQTHVKSSQKNQQQESRKRKSLNGLSNPQNQLRSSIDQSSSELHNMAEGNNRDKLKEKSIDRVNCEQSKRKNKKPEENRLHFEAVKHSKMEDMCSVDNRQDFNVDIGKLGSSSNSGLTNMEGGEGMLKHGDIGLTKHDKFKTVNKRQISSKKQGKPAEISSVDQVSGKSDGCTKKRKLKDWQDDQNSHNSALHVKEENCEGLKKKRKFHVSNDTHKRKGDFNSKREGGTTQFSASGSGNDFTNGVEEISKDKGLKMQKKIIYKQTSVGQESLKRNLGARQVSHLPKTKFGVKVSTAESVSSSPMRTSSLDLFGGEKEDITSNIHSDTRSKKIKPSPGVQHHFVTADANAFQQPRLCNNHIDDSMEPSHKKLKKVFPNKELSTENKDLFLTSNEKDKSVLSDVELDKAKASDGISKHSKKSMIREPEVDSYHVSPCPDGVGEIEQNIPRKRGTKLTRKEKIHVGAEGFETPHNIKGHDVEDQRPGTVIQSNRAVIIQNKSGLRTVETKDGKSKCSLSSGDESKGETLHLGGDPQQVSLMAGDSHQLIVVAPKSDDAVESKTLKNLGNAANKNGISLRYQTPDQQGSREVNASNPDRKKSSNQTACNVLEETKCLRDHADRLKRYGYSFESNEAFFQSALEYLHGAFLLETHSNASGKNGDLTHMQVYGITAELCKICAHEYERRQEMAAAALAYKCIEVAYMRIVYHKHTSINGDRNEMHPSFRTIVQGESPSSSASDVDNLNNQAAMDKDTIDKVGGSHVAGNHIANAGSCTSFLWLLDSTRDINLAMEAVKKSRNAFAAAGSHVSDAKNVTHLASVKKAIDFSFQDVEELIQLVRVALKTITHSVSGSGRD
ncbi:uncharacterized protein LOC111009697 isoform X3 [Momordica charantia]|uniref:Uncharacterized protein LOC111009697 isoform X3 n=1 Tax=Momordica charantia TaxID=3673 RepID=A0A6J1CBH6_MOMCH|nr:uncharacterized protein LOC111009697 isoform X3 [Momordica charantia]